MEKLKKTIIVWVSIYPPLTIILAVFTEYLDALPLYLKTFILTIFLVPLMIYILIPFWTRVFDMIRAKSEALRKNQSKQGY